MQVVQTREDAVTQLRRLSREFKVPAPGLYWSLRRRGGWYESGTVTIGPRTTFGLDAILVHEFAHHLTRYRVGHKIHHERPFCEALEQVARFYYGDVKLYPWHKEYVCVRNYAKRYGLLVETDRRGMLPGECQVSPT